MPRSYQYKTPNVPHWSISSSPTRYSPSYHFSGWYIDINTFAESINWHDDLATVVIMLEEDPVSFAKFVFLDYLCHNLKRIQQDLENQQNIAQHQLTRFFQWQNYQSSIWLDFQQTLLTSTSNPWIWQYPGTRLFHQLITIKSITHSSTTNFNASYSNLNITNCYQSSTMTMEKKFLEEEFPEDPLSGTQENPIIIEWSSFEHWFRESIGLAGEYCYNFYFLGPFLMIHIDKFAWEWLRICDARSSTSIHRLDTKLGL